MTSNDIRAYVNEWNLRFPIDRWWREKFNVAFGSSVHRESSIFNQLYQYTEDKMVLEARRKAEQEAKKKEEGFEEIENYIPGTGNWLSPRILEGKELDDAFENINLDDY